MSKKLINGKILAIQLGRNETQIALVDKNSEILHGITVGTPMGAVEDGMIHNQEAVTEMLKEALKDPMFKGIHQVVFALCTSQVIMETTTTPDMPKAKLEKLIQANADMYFPVDIQDYRLVWEVVDVKKNDAGVKEASVQLWAVPNEMLRPYYQAANACGLSVAAIDYCGHSAATAVGATFARPAKPPKAKAPEAPKEPKVKKKIDWNAEITFRKKKKEEPEVREDEETGPKPIPATDMHILMDKELLGLTFVQEGQVVCQRFYRCGSDPSYQFSELAMMVEYFQTQEIGRGSEIRGYVSGPDSNDADMVDLLSGMLGISLEVFHNGGDSCWLLCAGAAKTDLDFGNPAFNKTVRVRRTINTDLWQYAAILASGVALVMVVIALLNARLSWNSEISNLENQRNLLQIQAAKVSGFKENYENYQLAYDAYDRDWENLFDSLHTYNDNLVFVLKELENVMPENTSVTDIIIDSDSVMISFACDDKEEAAYLIMSLRDMEYVDVNTISNLIGGGKGAATEYGTPIEDVTPPSEGGSDEKTNAVVVTRNTTRSNAISGEVVLQSTAAPTLDDLTALQAAYGTNPPSVKQTHQAMAYADFAAFNAKHSITEADRRATISAMLMSNPFAANTFVELMVNDFNGKGTGQGTFVIPSEVYGRLIPLLMPLMSNTSMSYEEVLPILEEVLTILTEPETIGCTEKLMFTDPYMGTSYVHYLEANLGMWGEIPLGSDGSKDYSQYCPYINNADALNADSSVMAGWLREWIAGDMVADTADVVCGVCVTSCQHKDSDNSNYCDICGSIIDDTACIHPEENRQGYLPVVGTSKHTYTCNAVGCGKTITEDCVDADKDCRCDLCEAEKHNIVFGQIDGTRTHAERCTNEGCDKKGAVEVCTDEDGNEKCDVCGGSVAFTREEIEILEHTHGQVPQPAGEIPGDYEAYQEYLEDKHPTYFDREAAIVNLFCENAFAANDYFEDIVKIFGYEDKIEVTEEFKSIQSVLDKVGQLLEINSVDDNEKKLDQIEEMIFAYDSASGKYDIRTAYLYYLESVMSGKKEEDPHLLEKDQGDMTDAADPDRVLETWEYVKKQNEMTSSRADYENFLYNYLMSSSDKKAIKNKIGSELVADLEKYFDGADAIWEDKYEEVFQLSATDSNLRKLMKIGFLLNYYEDPYREYDVLDELVTDYRNGKSAYAAELLLALQLSEREAGIDKDKGQDDKLEEHEKEIEELKKQLEALKGDGKEDQGAAAGGSSVKGDTRVFLDIGLLYTEELWNQELQRKGLDRSAKLPRLEVEVG